MTPEQLKASIIHLALQGKLVGQRTEEGDAEELYRQIQEEKDKLIKLKIIKLDKNIPEPDEYPYDIPESWIWARITDCGSFISGYTPKPLELKSEGVIPYFKVADMNTEGNEVYLSITNSYLKDDNSTKYYLKNTIVYPKNGGAVFTNKKRILAQNSVVDLNTGGYSVIGPVSLMYFYLFFSQIDFRQCYKGTALPTIDMDKLKRKWIPLPPLKEQHRIVAKIEELLPFVDRYAASYEKLEQFNAKFPEEMKKSILQYAIQGKLVEQRLEEGTAEELYQQIQEERKGYKIKELSVDDIYVVPFDIPDTWKWIHLQDIVKKTIKRGKSPRYTKKSNIQVFAQKCNVKSGGINMGLALFLDEDTVEKYPVEEYMCNGDIVINSTGGGTMGRVGIFHDTDRIDDMSIVPDGHVTIIRACDTIDYKYLYYVIKHNQKYLETQGEGSTNQTELKPLTIASLVIPLPPLAEQHRIVAKIEEILPYCDKLANKE